MFAKQSVGKPVLIVDVGEGSVGAAVASLAHDVVVIHRSMRATLTLDDRTPEQVITAAIKALEEVCTKLLAANRSAEQTTSQINSIHIVTRAPWTKFRTASGDDLSQAPRTVTADWIAATGKKALEQPSELNRSSILEAGVLQVFLNGYPTVHPIGKIAQSINVVAYESDIDSGFKSSVETIFGKLLPDRTVLFHSNMRALLAVMHEYLPDMQRYVIIDVGGTTTSCAVVRKDSVTQHATANEGLLTILKKITQGGLPDETLSLLRMLSADTCSTTACQTMKDSLAKAEPELVRTFGDVFAQLAGERRLPNACMLAAPAELTPWLLGFFERIDFAQFTATTQPFSVDTFSTERLPSVHWPVGVAPDSGIGVAASSVNILEHAGKF